MSAKLVLMPGVSSAMIPLKATLDSAAVDLRANLDNPLTLMKGTGARVGTGVRIILRDGDCALVLPRSGFGGPPHFLTIPNAPGLIDPDYRDEIFVNLFCLGSKITIKPGDRIAQLLIVPYVKAQGVFGIKEDLRQGGAGSTGVK